MWHVTIYRTISLSVNWVTDYRTNRLMDQLTKVMSGLKLRLGVPCIIVQCTVRCDPKQTLFQIIMPSTYCKFHTVNQLLTLQWSSGNEWTHRTVFTCWTFVAWVQCTFALAADTLTQTVAQPLSHTIDTKLTASENNIKLQRLHTSCILTLIVILTIILRTLDNLRCLGCWTNCPQY